MLKLTLERQESGCEFDLQEAVIEKLKNPEIFMRELANWTKDFLQEIIMYKTIENEDYKGLDPELLCYSGFSPLSIKWARGEKQARAIRKSLA